jgi:hypothetical protein
MTHSTFIAVQVASSIGEARLSDIGMGSHGRDHMEEIEVPGHQFFGILVLEGGLVAADLDEGVFEGGFDVVVCCYLLQGFGVFGHTEHHCVCFEEFDLDGKFLLLPGVSPKIQNLLRSTCALNGQSGFGENGLARF